MPLNLPVVTNWTIAVSTAPPVPGPGGATMTFGVELFVNNAPQPVVLQVNSVDELNAIVGLLQIPGGQLYFNRNGMTLVKSSV